LFVSNPGEVFLPSSLPCGAAASRLLVEHRTEEIKGLLSREPVDAIILDQDHLQDSVVAELECTAPRTPSDIVAPVEISTLRSSLPVLPSSAALTRETRLVVLHGEDESMDESIGQQLLVRTLPRSAFSFSRLLLRHRGLSKFADQSVTLLQGLDSIT
jgi:hypothetical protein